MSHSGRRFRAGVSKLRQTEPVTQRTGAEMAWIQVEVGRANLGELEWRDDNDAKFWKDCADAKGCRQQKGHGNHSRKPIGSPKTRFSNFFCQHLLMFVGTQHGFELVSIILGNLAPPQELDGQHGDRDECVKWRGDFPWDYLRGQMTAGWLGLSRLLEAVSLPGFEAHLIL